ncbi:ATP-binding protein [Saprospira grandis]|uniref:ATP-binding protein n=1 Tax=Saprospira grandis TaxID=1008 RepID=UPI0022DD4A5D|nr:DUF499 domain-containing protein [Saprospira grandis]WBM74551.1 DUF499 domain-containing protein [Saprospira grandis]
MMKQINKGQRDHLFSAMTEFLHAIRVYIVDRMERSYADRWLIEYGASLYESHQEKIIEQLRAGATQASVIDFPHLKSWSLRQKELLSEDFGRMTPKLPTYFSDICDLRNDLAHFSDIDENAYQEGYLNMIKIIQALKKEEVVRKLEALRKAGDEESEKEAEDEAVVLQVVEKQKLEHGERLAIRPWFGNCQPHLDIRQGRLDESVFAANLTEVATAEGRSSYIDSQEFFAKTYFTAGLKSIARRVLNSLNGKDSGENRVISLQTGFGGGKTHSLISLYHLCKEGNSLNSRRDSNLQELLKATGPIDFSSAKVAVFTNTTNDPANGRLVRDDEGELQIQTIWGELAYQLGGRSAYEIVKKNDEQRSAPAGRFQQVLEMVQPALILIDELADYCVKASAIKVGSSNLSDQTVSFMQELTEAVSATARTAAVITLPASVQEVGNTPQAQSILGSLEKRVSRVGADSKPVADEEIYEVLRRRLFEQVDLEEAEKVADRYLQFYQDNWTELPEIAVKQSYRKKIIKAYPFHPELIDIFRNRWASHHDFQRTRGALRLLAAIISDLWKRRRNLFGPQYLIHPSQVNFENLDALSSQLKRLYGNGYDAVISSDVAGSASNAFRIDEEKPEYGQYDLTQGLGSIILMNSFGADSTRRGISLKEIKLQLLGPAGPNHNSVNGALYALEGRAHHLYHTEQGTEGKRYWFHTQPNINILINQFQAAIKKEAIEQELMERLRLLSRGTLPFRLIVDPQEALPEQNKFTLVIMPPRDIAQNNKLSKAAEEKLRQIVGKKGQADRIYRNTLLFLFANPSVLGTVESAIALYLASKQTEREYKNLDKGQMEDLRRRKQEANDKIERNLPGLYNYLVKYSMKDGAKFLLLQEDAFSLKQLLEHKIIDRLKEEQWLLDSLGRSLLSKHNLWPTEGNAISVQMIYEAFLRYDDKPLITGPEAISQAIQTFLHRSYCALAEGASPKALEQFYEDSLPFGFQAEEEQFYLIDLTDLPEEEVEEVAPDTKREEIVEERSTPEELSVQKVDEELRYTAFQTTGQVGPKEYTKLFDYFIRPFLREGDEISIDLSFNIKTGTSFDEKDERYQRAKEAAKQLGFNIRLKP